MALNALMMGNIQSGQGSAVLQMDSQAMQKYGGKSNNTTFGELLGSSMDNAERQNNVKRYESKVSACRKKTEQISGRPGNKPRYLSFREANERNVKTSASESTTRSGTKLSEARDKRPDKIEDASESEAAMRNQPNSMIYTFAQVLGLNINDLQKLLADAGIARESFSDIQSVVENATKISQLLGLNSEQQDTLAKMFQLACETMKSLTAVQTEANSKEITSDMKSTADSETDGTQQLSTSEGNREALQSASAFESLAAKLGLKIKIKLDEFSTKLAVDQNTVEAELEQIIRHLPEKAAMEKQQPLQQTIGADIIDTVEQNVTNVGTKAKTATKQGDAGQDANANADSETVILQPVETVIQVQPRDAFAAVQPGNVNIIDTIKPASAEASVIAKEIINQVIEQAKVVLTPEKSEISMDLKPESLGRISLKVVTENGIVMAKFIADSHQVRQVLEANMQLLRDSLEKQGMLVQGFSVSVRQDTNQSGRNWTKPQNGTGRGITGTAYRTAEIGSSLADVPEAAVRENPYQWGSSTINLTA